MGNSKIVMLSGIYLILGMYTLSFQSGDNINTLSVESAANNVQAEKLARAGISMALSKMGSNSSLFSYPEESVSGLDGTIIHSASRPAGYSTSQSKVMVTGIFNADTVTASAVFSYERGRWRLSRIYYPPTF